MTAMVIRLVLSLVLVGAALWFAARIAKRRGIGQGSGLIEVVARQRMGRSSSVNLIRVADLVLVGVSLRHPVAQGRGPEVRLGEGVAAVRDDG